MVRVIKVVSTITLIVVLDDEIPNPAWFKNELERIQGVAAARIDGYATAEVFSLSLGPQKPKPGD